MTTRKGSFEWGIQFIPSRTKTGGRTAGRAADRVAKIFDTTKQEAQDAGRGRARREGVEHIIHKKDGTIGERNSYGNDPYSPKR